MTSQKVTPPPEPITLHLPLTRHWYDETVKQENPKRIEYRSLTSIDPDTKQPRPSKNIRDIWDRRDRIARVRFSRAYTTTTREFAVERIDRGPCPIPDWDAPEYIRIHFTDLPTTTPGDDAIMT